MSARRRSRGGAARGGRVLRFVRQLPTRPSELDPFRENDRPDAAFEGLWRDGVKRRTIIVLSILGLWATGVEARLVNLQIFQHAAMLREALREQEEVIHPVGIRGDIVDRHGAVLAYSVAASAITATPKNVIEPVKTVEALCLALEDCTANDRTEFLTMLSTTSRAFGYVRRAGSMTPGQADRIKALKLKGIALLPDTQRYYPDRELAAHVLGYVGRDNSGLGGIEHAYDGVIRGESGTVRVQVDARKQSMVTRVDEAPTTGATVELALDQYLQYIAERELAAGVAEHHADAGTVVIMDPKTGEVLAMANVPTFNPNAYEQVSAEVRRNRAVQDAYEPGSIFKIVTVSAALQEGVWSLGELIDTAPGYLQIGSRRIHDSEGHNNGVLSVEDVVVKSSNVGAGKMGLRIGAERMERYVQRFGFGKVLLPDLPGQSAGRVYGLAELTDSALASLSIGYQVSVTALQMATCVSAVANGGTLYEPHLVRALIRDGVREPVAPNALRQAITPETAATITSILENVVLRGTGVKAAVDGYSVAGKTGTAAKLINHAYSETAYNASFVGFVPSRHPVLAIVVVVDTPHGGSYFGGDVAAPIFSRIADAALRQLRVPPTAGSRASLVLTPDPQPAPAPRPAPVLSPILLNPAQAAGLRMPDLRGLTVREAVRALDDRGLLVRLTGAGVVTSQTPQAGEPVEAGAPTTLLLGRLPVVPSHPAVGGGVR